MVRFEDIIPIIGNKVICIANGERTVFTDKSEILDKVLYKNYEVVSIGADNGNIVLDLRPFTSPNVKSDPEWEKEYKEQNGFEPCFF